MLTQDIYPPHSIQDWDKFEAMVAVLESGGTLPPVLVNGVQAYSGSHRIAAWQQCEMDIDYIEISDEEYKQIMESMNLDPVYDVVYDFEIFLEQAVSLGFADVAK